MSSEMRELIAKWRAVAEKQRGMASRDNEGGDLECAARMAGMAERTEYMADELEATLIAELEQEVAPVADERLCDFFADVGEVEQFMDDLCNVVTELTGDEGEDDPITVLSRYIATSPAHTSEARDVVSEEAIVALVAGPYMYHHKMDEQAEREGKAFDRCRELTIQNIRTYFATRNACDAGFDLDEAANIAALVSGKTAAPVADGAAPLWISCHWREDLARDSVVSVVNRQDPAHTLQVYVSTRPHDASAREVLTDHGRRALFRCINELTRFIELAEDYDLDEMSVQALQTSIESMQMRLAAALPSPPKEREE